MLEHAGPVRPLLVTAVFTGLRASELRGLTWDDVDFDAKTLTVRQRADRWDTLGAPKSDSGKRTIPLAPVVVSALREWKLACPRFAEAGERRLRFVFPYISRSTSRRLAFVRERPVTFRGICGVEITAAAVARVISRGEP